MPFYRVTTPNKVQVSCRPVAQILWTAGLTQHHSDIYVQ